jgi:hypothetical protein
MSVAPVDEPPGIWWWLAQAPDAFFVKRMKWGGIRHQIAPSCETRSRTLMREGSADPVEAGRSSRRAALTSSRS